MEERAYRAWIRIGLGPWKIACRSYSWARCQQAIDLYDDVHNGQPVSKVILWEDERPTAKAESA